jgi:hypothetical protein
MTPFLELDVVYQLLIVLGSISLFAVVITALYLVFLAGWDFFKGWLTAIVECQIKELMEAKKNETSKNDK